MKMNLLLNFGILIGCSIFLMGAMMLIGLTQTLSIQDGKGKYEKCDSFSFMDKCLVS